ncbi:MAG: cupredoxin family protein [Nitrosomonadaceae bacterium]|nr:cupredoxin family protein [Nitrosomonadaceae bacterium]
MKKFFIASVLAISLIPAGAVAQAYQDDREGSAAVGKLGDSGKVSRTIEITMVDNRFKPAEIKVKQGETVKFVLRNAGEKKHDMMIGSMAQLDKHAKMMKKFPDMEHADPNLISVDPGKSGELVWQFTEVGTVDFACPRPGHFKGMRGRIIVEDK